MGGHEPTARMAHSHRADGVHNAVTDAMNSHSECYACRLVEAFCDRTRAVFQEET